MNRRFAIGVIENRNLISVPQTCLTIAEAKAYAETYNRIERERRAVILLHPISWAIRSASAKSRSA